MKPTYEELEAKCQLQKDKLEAINKLMGVIESAGDLAKDGIENLEQQLSESRREFWAADATINNLELKLAEMAAQLANTENKCAALAADNEKAMEAMRQADAAVKLAHEKFSALAASKMQELTTDNTAQQFESLGRGNK